MKPAKRSRRHKLPPGMPFKNDQEYAAWLNEDPRRGEALIKVYGEALREQKDHLPPKKWKEMQRLYKTLRRQLTSWTVPERFNAIATRLLRDFVNTTFTPKKVAELEGLEEEIKHLIELALDMPPKQRAKAIPIMRAAAREARRVLNQLDHLGKVNTGNLPPEWLLLASLPRPAPAPERRSTPDPGSRRNRPGR